MSTPQPPSTYGEVVEYMTEIDKLALEYNNDKIPLWLLDALGPTLRKMATATNNYIYTRSDYGAGIDPTYIRTMHTEVTALTDDTKLDNKMDPAVIATWWTLKHRESEFIGLVYPTNDADFDKYFTDAKDNKVFNKAVHDAWAFSRLYAFIPEYTSTGCVLTAYPVTNSSNHNGSNGPAQQWPVYVTEKGDPIETTGNSDLNCGNTYSFDAVRDIAGGDRNLKKNMLITINIGEGGGRCIRIKDLKLFIEYDRLQPGEAVKDAGIGASLMRMIKTMENETYSEASRGPITLANVFKSTTPLPPPAGGAPRKKKSSSKAVVVAKAKLAAAAKKKKKKVVAAK